MPIIRRQFDFERKEFTQIPNAWLRDERLSLKSKGLLAQILSHSVGWSMTVAALGKANNCGYHAITASIQELESAGYLKRTQTKDDKGRFAEVLWFTTDPNSPMSENPMSDNPMSENPTLKKTKEKNTKEKNTNADVFDQFWGLYPRKVGKASARKAFGQLHIGDRAKAMHGVLRLKNDPNLPPTQYVPHPATWLNREGWEDEPYPKRETPTTGRVETKSPYVGGPREWVKDLHDQGEHYECRPNEFGCK